MFLLDGVVYFITKMAVCDDVWVTVVSWISQDSYLKPLSSSDDLLIGGVFVSQTPLIPHPDND